MEFAKTSFSLLLRTNDNFEINVDVGYNITAFTPQFVIRKNNVENDLSQYIVKISANTFTLSIHANIVEAIGEMMGVYDCIIDMGNGSKDFLFGGSITIIKGIA